MGIPIISQEGLLVKHAKRFILECHICKVLVRDTSKLFCSSCGNDSLLKVSCSVNNDGTIVLYRKRNFKINLRGQ
jgi:RNA-binding protein NOB1